ncbi:hypothetical protein WBU96_28225 [Bacillus albus]
MYCESIEATELMYDFWMGVAFLITIVVLCLLPLVYMIAKKRGWTE